MACLHPGTENTQWAAAPTKTSFGWVPATQSTQNATSCKHTPLPVLQSRESDAANGKSRMCLQC